MSERAAAVCFYALESQLPETVVYSVGIEMYEDAARSIQRASIDAGQADAMKLPFADASFDCALCSLVLHHLEPIAASNLLSEMARIAHHGIYVIDLDREPLPYYLYKVFGRFSCKGLRLRMEHCRFCGPIDRENSPNWPGRPDSKIS